MELRKISGPGNNPLTTGGWRSMRRVAQSTNGLWSEEPAPDLTRTHQCRITRVAVAPRNAAQLTPHALRLLTGSRSSAEPTEARLHTPCHGYKHLRRRETLI